MKRFVLPTFTLAASLLAPLSALAHTSYSNRNFGTLNLANPSATISSAASGISSLFGWADGTDADYGDAHRIKAFRFTLETAGTVIIEVQATGAGNPLLPAFSLYSGLLHVPPAGSATDAAELTLEYLAALGGAEKEGAFYALGNMAMANEGEGATLRYLTYVGNAADGTSSNYGAAAGINGDGIADGFVTASFYLPAGDYSILAGGADYSAQGPAPYTTYASEITVTAVPEPSTWILTGIAAIAFALVRRRSASAKG